MECSAEPCARNGARLIGDWLVKDNNLLLVLAALWLLTKDKPPPGWHPPMALPPEK
jgi:hypothetical protein